jgi:hypothetical protein
MRLLVLVALAALAAGCQRIERQEEVERLAPGCDARAVHEWVAGETQLSVEATTVGPDCSRAVATFVVRDGSGVPLYTDVHIAEHVMTLAPARDQAAMQTALEEWVMPSTMMISSSALPDWPANAAAPQNGEFPFYPEEGYDRESYMALRTNNVPLFCYVQGMESMACIAFSGDGDVSKIGVQSFPG